MPFLSFVKRNELPFCGLVNIAMIIKSTVLFAISAFQFGKVNIYGTFRVLLVLAKSYPKWNIELCMNGFRCTDFDNISFPFGRYMYVNTQSVFVFVQESETTASWTCGVNCWGTMKIMDSRFMGLKNNLRRKKKGNTQNDLWLILLSQEKGAISSSFPIG